MKNGNKDLISVIVPIFQVEQYLDRCISSIVRQTYENLEIILVDDSSSDKCPEICDAWAKKDRRIQVIHKVNGGLSSARNAGIDIAKGAWLTFVDSDDYIANTFVESLYSIVVRMSSDIAVCGSYQDATGNCFVVAMKQNNEVEIYKRERILKEYFTDNFGPLISTWNKIYNRRIFFDKDNLRFPVGRLHEDAYMMYKFLWKANKVAVSKKPLYYYVFRTGSIINSFGTKNMQDTYDFLREAIEWTKRNIPVLTRAAQYCAWNQFLGLSYICRKNSSIDPDGTILKKIYNLGNHVIFNPYANIKAKLKYILLQFHLLWTLQSVWHKVKNFWTNIMSTTGGYNSTSIAQLIHRPLDVKTFGGAVA